MSTDKLQQIYQQGLSDESRVKNFFRGLGYQVTNSSKIEDTRQDIDCFIRYSGKEYLGVSIKCDSTCSRNLAFELHKHLRQPQVKLPGWYYSGRAELYAIWKKADGLVYVVDKERLMCYIERYGWDRVTDLTPMTKAIQSAHNQYNTDIGLIAIKELLRYEVAYIAGELKPPKSNNTKPQIRGKNGSN